MISFLTTTTMIDVFNLIKYININNPYSPLFNLPNYLWICQNPLLILEQMKNKYQLLRYFNGGRKCNNFLIIIRKKENTCGHEDKLHYAKQMCRSCYSKYGRIKKPWNCPHQKLYACIIFFYIKYRGTMLRMLHEYI